MYVKYWILTKYLHGALGNFLLGILAVHKNDKSFAPDRYQSNLNLKQERLKPNHWAGK